MCDCRAVFLDMTENLPRGNFGPIPSSLPAVSWFEFLLNEELLEKHLQKENPGMYYAMQYKVFLLISSKKNVN